MVTTNLDTRRWPDLIEEARAMVPRFAAGWTDHNASDPGMTLLDLLAWYVEADVYRLNRLPQEHLLAFLRLAGIEPRGPLAARTVVSVMPPVAVAVDLPAGTELQGSTSNGESLTFRMLTPVHALPLGALTLLWQAEPEAAPGAPRARNGAGLAPLGLDPLRGAALWLGFELALPAGEESSFYFSVAGDRSGCEEERRIREEATARARACERPANPCADDSVPEPLAGASAPAVLLHHSVRTAWEFHGAGGWRALDAEAGEVRDETRGLTLSGFVRLTLPAAMTALDAGDGIARFYLRVRLDEGEYDAPPLLASVAVNAVAVEQAYQVVKAFRVAAGVIAGGAPPATPGRGAIDLALDDASRVTGLSFEGDGPDVEVLHFRGATATADGLLILGLDEIGRGAGTPEQAIELRQTPVQAGSLSLWSVEAAEGPPQALTAWKQRATFYASRNADRHFVLSLDTERLTLGDGNQGRVAAAGEHLLAAWRKTAGARGNLRAASIGSIAGSLRNWLLLDGPGFAAASASLSLDALLAADPQEAWSRLDQAGFEVRRAATGTLSQPEAVSGGAAAETVAAAAARAHDILGRVTRAITRADYETLAHETPGAQLARSHAIPGMHPALPGLQAPGVATVVIVPAQNRERPYPSAGLLTSVQAYLDRRRLLGTSIQVTGPSYVTVRVTGRVRALYGADPSRVQGAVIERLRRFLHPLLGGPAVFESTRGSNNSSEAGWPFGRDVYRSEVLQVIDEVEGVDNVIDLELMRGDCESTCLNVCVGPTELVVSGDHRIEVVQ